jgi:hypothetical protein
MRALLENTQAAYAACWRTLAGIKGLRTSEEFFQDLLQFQPTLARALCDLDRADRDLEQGREELVRRKAKTPHEQFLSEIRQLGRYQEVIREAGRLGRNLGDAFAWFFYQEELPRLLKHQEHKPVTEIPTGVGHDGELTFINNVKVVNGHLVLYHGITTLLRHGDVSLIDLATFKLTCLGELKSRDAGDGQIEVTAHFVAPKDHSIPSLFRDAPISSKPSAALPARMCERFRRQLHGMAESFKPIPAREDLTLEQDTGFPALMELADELERSEVAYQLCGQGLLLIGLRTDQATTLFDKLAASKFDAIGKLHDLGRHVERLIDRSQAAGPDANRFIISGIGRETLPGATPLFWWPLKVWFLRKLFFQDVIMVTVYNPAHLIRKLRGQGFKVQPLGNLRYDIYKTIGGNRMSLEGFDYFQKLIQDHLIDENVVLSTLSHADGIIASGKVGSNARIPFYIFGKFQPYAASEETSVDSNS